MIKGDLSRDEPVRLESERRELAEVVRKRYEGLM